MMRKPKYIIVFNNGVYILKKRYWFLFYKPIYYASDLGYLIAYYSDYITNSNKPLKKRLRDKTDIIYN